MISLWLFIIAFVLALFHTLIRRTRWTRVAEVYLLYIIFFNIGIMGLLAFYAHLYMADETAKAIGWAAGSPFQSEIGMANLSYGILGVLSVFFRKNFWAATIFGYCTLLFGAFFVHIKQWSLGDVAPLNIGGFVWFNDLILPLILLFLLACKYLSELYGERVD